MKKIYLYVIIMLAATQQLLLAGFTPHNEPLVSHKPPKPNIYLIIDDSGSMRWRVDADENVDPNDPKAQTRTDLMRPVIYDLIDNYAKDAYIGFSALGNDKNGSNPDSINEIHPNSPNQSLTVAEWLMQDIPEVKELARRPKDGQIKYDNTHFTNLYPINDLTNDRERSRFNYIVNKYTDPGQKIAGEIGFVKGGTPLANALYSASLYLRNKPMYLGLSTVQNKQIYYERNFDLTYRCQETYAVLLSDGEGNSATVYGILPGEWHLELLPEEKNRSLFVIAEHAYNNIDLRDNYKDKANAKDQAGMGWFDEGSKKLPINLHAIAFADKNAIFQLQESVKPSNGIAVQANNQEELRHAFHQIFQDIIGMISDGGTIQDQFEITKDSVRYESYFDPRAWVGEIRAIPYKTRASTNQAEEESVKDDPDWVRRKPLWSTNERIKPNQGRFMTISGKNLETLGFNPEQISWLKGNNVKGYKDRMTILGDIINSTMVYHANDRLNINIATLGSQGNQSRKRQFQKYLVQKQASMSSNLLIVGTNDGMLNFIAADKGRSNNIPAGSRVAAYFPSFFANDIDDIMALNYVHKYRVDGHTNLFDAYIQPSNNSFGRYKTIGITGMGAGKEALIGYEVFSMSADLQQSSSEIKPTFEITSKDSGFEDLAYTYSSFSFINQHSIATGETRAVAVFGNGFGKDTSVIYAINANTGKQIQKIKLKGKGLGSPELYVQADSETGYQFIHSLYVGDYDGTLHRVDFNTNSNDSKFNLEVRTQNNGSNSHVLFKADQPITVKPMIAKKNPHGNVWVYFGTGMAASLDDIAPTSLVDHYFYGLKDINETITFNQLIAQYITNEEHKPNSSTFSVYTSNEVTAGSEPKYGWQFKVSKESKTGERVIKPAARNTNGYIHFVTWGHRKGRDNDPCDPNIAYGKSLFLDLWTGNSINKKTGLSGTGSTVAYPGIATGPFMDNYSLLSGGGNSMHNQLDKDILDTLSGTKNSSYPKEKDAISPGKNTANNLLSDGDTFDFTFDDGNREPEPSDNTLLGRLYFKRVY